MRDHRLQLSALAYKYLNGSLALRAEWSASEAKGKLFDPLSIYTVKYDSAGSCFQKSSVAPFPIVQRVAAPPDAEFRAGRYACIDCKYTNADNKILFSCPQNQALWVFGSSRLSCFSTRADGQLLAQPGAGLNFLGLGPLKASFRALTASP